MSKLHVRIEGKTVKSGHEAVRVNFQFPSWEPDQPVMKKLPDALHTLYCASEDSDSESESSFTS